MKFGDGRGTGPRQHMQAWAFRREEDTLRDANGFILLENAHEYGKLSEFWNNKKKEACKSAKKTALRAKDANAGPREKREKVHFFETFDQMTQTLREKKGARSRRKKEKSEKSRQKSNEEGPKSSHSVSESRKSGRRKAQRLHKDSGANRQLLQGNLEDLQAQKIGFLTERLEQQRKEFKEYSRRAEDALRLQILRNEAHEKQQRRRELSLAKERLGEFVLRSGMAKTKEVWVDRGVMKRVKQQLARVRREKEVREKFRKALKRRKNSTVTAEEINSGELVSAKESKRTNSRKPVFERPCKPDLPDRLDTRGARTRCAIQPAHESALEPAVIL